ncbi:acetaldehyde dehydrogenase (acetylating) [Lentilactobacillus sp. IMAU92037]|uniref:acetaldehyde dehydrogenase (acetylating) n=1 Tax=Lentilactobacillus dabitei TaxID=2831523 RepID=UPI001C2CBED0|nr:acetaldehyde dehydrogenase (acetylating) [Lentilactobacillus dabitei]MBV0929579.1 acetaldehyde dehydrogenase (acetylating) [Lentilactobacillus dabitei]
MNLTDEDLASIQEVRTLLHQATRAQKIFSQFSQEKVNAICQAMADAGVEASERLAKMAQKETGYGIWQDKVLKNIFGSKTVNERYRDMKTVGILSEDPEHKIIDMAVPVGVIAGLIPSTNPTSSVFYKSIISVKSGNAIVISPHPKAKECTLEAIKVVSEAAYKAGAPAGLISGITIPTLAGTDELMRHDETKLILATGGGAMVHAAYSSGTPALGVGPGNGPAYIEKSADVAQAVKRIMDSETFDNGTICASEQSIIVEEANKDAVRRELENQGGYFLTSDEIGKLSKFILRADGTMNPQIVGKSIKQLADLADIDVPAGTRVLIARDSEENIGPDDPYSREKLTPILAYFEVDDCNAAAALTTKLLLNEGAGHTAILHSENQKLIRQYASLVPASRVLVNTPGALGGIGATTDLNPALTLGCGAIGGSATSDNISPMNLMNLKRVAVGMRELKDIKADSSVSQTHSIESSGDLDHEQLVEELVRQVLAQIK